MLINPPLHVTFIDRELTLMILKTLHYGEPDSQRARRDLTSWYPLHMQDLRQKIAYRTDTRKACPRTELESLGVR